MTVHDQSRFTHLEIQGFRRLHDVDLTLRPFSVLIGANGVGKTSFLDAFRLLASSAQGKLSEALSDYSGLANILTYDRTDKLRLGVDMNGPSFGPIEYYLTLVPFANGHQIQEEILAEQLRGVINPFYHIDSHGSDIRYFDRDRNETVRPNWEYRPFETSLSQVPKMFKRPEEFRNRLASATFYHTLDVEPRSPIRLPQPVQPAALPGRNGEELVSCLFALRETDHSRFESIQDSLRAAFPRFERLEFPPVAAGTLALAWREKGFSKPLYMHQLSEGTLRFLWLATLLQSPGLPALTLIDEPEVSLHPEMLSLLADLLREATVRTQLVVATHSDRLIRFLKPDEILVFNSDEEGMTSVKWAFELDLDRWLSEYTLDELWANGRLGARA